MTTTDFTFQLSSIHEFMQVAAYKFTLNKEHAKDLIQDTALKAYVNREKFKTGTNFKGWIYIIMRNNFINRYHAEKLMKSRTIELDGRYNIASKENIGNPEDLLNAKNIQQIIDSLNQLYRVPFSMFLEGYEYHEIADKLALPIGTVKSRMYTARKKLKDLIQRNYEAA